MSSLTSSAALLCTGLGLVSATAVLARTRELQQALLVLLDLLLAAGLLRLALDGTWRALTMAALVMGVRTLAVGYGLRPAEQPSRAA